MARSKKGTELSQEELARQAQERAIYRLPSTYSIVTAERLLMKLGIPLNQHIVSKQIQEPHAYYHALLYVPAKRLNISVDIERCRDIQAYGQQKLIHYLFSGEAAKEETEGGQSLRNAIESDRQQLVEMGKDFQEWEDNTVAQTEQAYNELRERAQAWRRTIEEVVLELKSILSSASLPESKEITHKFTEHLLESSTRLAVSTDQISKYRLPDNIGIVEKTVICIIDKLSPSDALNRSSLKKLRPSFEALDKKMRSDFDSLTGFNQEKDVAIKGDLMFISDLTTKFENHIANVARKLFSYYKEYASDKGLRVEQSEALEHGVDESVADDYKALHEFKK